MKRIFNIIVTLLILGFLTAYTIQSSGFFDAFLIFEYSSLFLLYFLYLFFSLVNTVVIYYLLRRYKVVLKLGILFGINQVSSFYGYLSPLKVGNAVSKVYYFKKYLGLEVGDSLNVFFYSSFIGIFVSIFLLLLISIVFSFDYFLFYSSLVFVTIILITSLIVALGRIKTLKESLIVDRIKAVFFGSEKLSLRDNGFIVTLFIFQFVLAVYITDILFSAVGLDVELLKISVLVLVGNLSSIAAVAPGNIGLKELTYFGVASVFGLDVDLILAALLIDRFVQITFLGVSTLLFHLFVDGRRKEIR